MTEIVPPFERNDLCWCGSGRPYKRCHGEDRRSGRGAPTPPDDDDGVWIYPHTKLAHGAIEPPAAYPPGGVPVVVQRDHPVATPLVVPEWARLLAAAERADMGRTLADCGRARTELLDSYGLDNLDTLEAQLGALSDDALTEMAEELVRVSRSTLDVVAANATLDAPRSILWADGDHIAEMIGQTMLWADHYLLDDALLEAFMGREAIDRDALNRVIADQVPLRPLIDCGVVVPVPAKAALAMAEELVKKSLEADLKNDELVRWVYRQLLIEGPSAREVITISAVDDDSEQGSYFYNRQTAPGGEMSMLNAYDENHDYGPWIDTVQKQYVARILKDLNSSVGVASMFGGEYVTRVPFKARLANRRLGQSSPTAAALAATVRVPWLPGADPATLAKAAGEDEAVEDLRRRVARAIRRSQDPRADLSDVAEELAEEAAGPLKRKIERENRWKIVVPGGCAVGGLLLAATTGPVVGVVGAALGGAMWAGPAFADRRQTRADAAYLFWMANPTRRRR